MSEILPRILAGAVALTVAMLALLTGFGFLLSALYVWLGGMIQPELAALTVAGVCFIVVIAVIVSVKIALSPPAPPVQQASAASSGDAINQDAAVQLAQDLGRLGAEKVRDNPWGTMAAAVIAGVVVGASPDARRQLFDLLDRFLK